MRANRVVCRVVGVQNDQEMIGRTDFDFFPPAIAAQYVDEDRRVIKSRSPLSDQIWLVPDTNGVPQIFLCNKVPLFGNGCKLSVLQESNAHTGRQLISPAIAVD